MRDRSLLPSLLLFKEDRNFYGRILAKRKRKMRYEFYANDTTELLWFLLAVHSPTRTSAAWRSMKQPLQHVGFLSRVRMMSAFTNRRNLQPPTEMSADDNASHGVLRSLVFYGSLTKR